MGRLLFFASIVIVLGTVSGGGRNCFQFDAVC